MDLNEVSDVSQITMKLKNQSVVVLKGEYYPYIYV